MSSVYFLLLICQDSLSLPLFQKLPDSEYFTIWLFCCFLVNNDPQVEFSLFPNLSSHAILSSSPEGNAHWFVPSCIFFHTTSATALTFFAFSASCTYLRLSLLSIWPSSSLYLAQTPGHLCGTRNLFPAASVIVPVFDWLVTPACLHPGADFLNNVRRLTCTWAWREGSSAAL